MNRSPFVAAHSPTTVPTMLPNIQGGKGKIALFIAKAQKKCACTKCGKKFARGALILTAKRARSHDLIGTFCPPEGEVRMGRQEATSPCYTAYIKAQNSISSTS